MSTATLFLFRLTLAKYVLGSDKGGPPARFVTVLRILDLDHLRAHVAEQHGAEWSGQHAGEVDDSHARQRQCRRSRFGHAERVSDRGRIQEKRMPGPGRA